MRVFFVSAPKANKVMGDILARLYAEIERLGHFHTNDLLAMSPQVFEAAVQGNTAAMEDFYEDMMASIRKADVCIFEASVASSGVGFLIDKSLAQLKPTVVLFYKEESSYLLPGVDDEKLIIRVYDDGNYRRVLEEVLADAAAVGTHEMTLSLSHELYGLLERESAKHGVSKAQFLRSLLSRKLHK